MKRASAIMEHRGKQFSVVQALEGGLWKWEVSGLDGHTRSGTAPVRTAGIQAAKAAIDKALAPKKRRLVPPGKRLSCCRFNGHQVKLIRACARTQQG